MRKIIRNHVCDTKTAKCLAQVVKSDGSEEGLYRTKAGLFFLYNSGGDDGPACIKEVNYFAAEKWAFANMDQAAYDASIFGEVAAEFGEQTTEITLTAERMKKLDRKAAQNGMTKSQYISRWIDRY